MSDDGYIVPPPWLVPPTPAPAQQAPPPPPPPVIVAPAPVPLLPPPPPPGYAAPAVAPVEIDDSTVHVSRPARAWRLEFEGSLPVVVRGALFLGRNPTANAEHPGATVLAIDDPSKSVSKTHALIELYDGALWLTDLHSTNGCAVLGADGTETEVGPGEAVEVPAGSTITLGQFAIQVHQS